MIMNQGKYIPPIVSEIRSAFSRKKRLIQIITGPRQVGKTTAAGIIAEKRDGETHYASADTPVPVGAEWIRHHWNMARKTDSDSPLLIIDEVQKIKGWSEQVKALWDEDERKGSHLDVLLLGSSALMLMKGASESLTGRFFLHRMHHWQFAEMEKAFGVELDQWLYFGGYPGAVDFYGEEALWKRYIRDSLIETVLSRDVLQMSSIAKPALLRHLFFLSCAYPAQILSYNKMLGQLVDAGNTTTLSHYVDILDSAFLLTGLEQYKIGQRPKRGSSPKLVLWNNALINALSTREYVKTREDPELWGRIVENSVGASLLNELQALPWELYYWRQGNDEVDYILHTSTKTWAIEVKSSRMKQSRGLQRFLDLHRTAEPFIVGGSGMELETFFRTPKGELFS
jgi:uncharacterized protein